ncbi:MAG TPA: hypothetical protein VHL34_05600, partial [Rhizomicrobium sp.]|nr:hypothetical protein [Rhizomicrobium sp.]
ATRMLMEDARIGDIAFNPADKSIWGVRRMNGVDTLVRIRASHDAWNQVVTFTYGHALTDLDISPDGQLLAASTAEINGDQRLEVYRISDLLNGNATPVAFMALGQSGPEGGAFSPDGKYLYATAYYTGVSNVYRLEIATNKVEAVSNAVTGFFRPVPMPDGSLIVYEYTGQGFQPVRIDPKPLNDLGNVKFLGTEIADKYPIVKSWAVGSPSKIDIDGMITDKGIYEPRDEMRYDGSYPIVEGYKGHVALGWHFQMEDPLLYNQLLANVAYSPANNIHTGEQFHADISYSTLYWKFTYWHNDANFYDLFGPTDNSRKGDAAIAKYHEVLIFDPPRQLDLSAEVGYYNGLDALPGAQNVSGGVSNLVSGKLAFDYTNIDKSLGAVDYEAGYRANLTLQNDYGHQVSNPKVRAGFDFGFALPWKHSSLWLYSSAGLSMGDPSNVLDYYYFGAFGNNFVDDGEVKRYRNYDSFPGFDIDGIKGRSFGKSEAEWNLPPIRFEDVGVPAFYLSSIRSAVFGGIMVADEGPTTSATYENIGFQVDWNFTIAVRLPMTLSAGYAKGFGPAAGRHDEIMISLKIL